MYKNTCLDLVCCHILLVSACTTRRLVPPGHLHTHCAWGAGRDREKKSERTCRRSARTRTHTHTQRERDGEETRARVRVRRPVRHVRGRCATCRRPGGRPRGSKNPGRPSAQLPLPPRLADHVVIPLCRPAAQGVVDSGTRGRRAHSGGACRAP